MKVYVVLVRPGIDYYNYVRAVFYDEEHAREDAKKYLRNHPNGWARTQSFIVV